MTTKLGDQPAYPCELGDSQFVEFIYPGLTIRQEGALRAMQGLLSNPDNVFSKESIAKESVKYADALLAELEKGSI